jgi:EAL domain-containing protein (putative c-di-GMP-specific phosphodiesterase class I)
VLRDPRSLGVRVSLDDFGSGYSSLTYAKELPVDGLKIESRLSTVWGGRGERRYRALDCRLRTHAGSQGHSEGVDNERQVASLTAMRCDLAQGFYFSRPLGSEAAGALVATNPLWQVPG